MTHIVCGVNTTQSFNHRPKCLASQPAGNQLASQPASQPASKQASSKQPVNQQSTKLVKFIIFRAYEMLN